MNFDELYQEVILDHARSPQNFGPLENPDVTAEGTNPACGDEIKLQLKWRGGEIEEARFTGQGCAICMASASLMTRAIKRKPSAFATALFERFRGAVAGQAPADASMGDLAALSGVRHFPQRVKCAMLPWETLRQALSQYPGAGDKSESR